MMFGGDSNNFEGHTDSESGTGGRQRFPDVKSEQPTVAEREKWHREAERAMTSEQKAVMRGATPAKLLDRASVDVEVLFPSLDSAATGYATRESQRAKCIIDNARNATYVLQRMNEIKDDIASELGAATVSRRVQEGIVLSILCWSVRRHQRSSRCRIAGL